MVFVKGETHDYAIQPGNDRHSGSDFVFAALDSACSRAALCGTEHHAPADRLWAGAPVCYALVCNQS